MRRKRLTETAELDIVPVMSLIVHLIPMLLLCVRFSMLAQVPTKGQILPTRPAESLGAYEGQQEKVVSVRVSSQGFVVGGLGDAEAIPCTATPCTPATYDYASLNAAMVAAKQLHPTESRVVIAPEHEIPYEVVIQVMSATRERLGDRRHAPLFPDARLASDDAPGSAPPDVP
ncbi:MAG: biopolymer transporter ExbD [Pseudomonadota bacterium]|nr:biopolymer transporter ExbD [Pseudomonadota bacterium]